MTTQMQSFLRGTFQAFDVRARLAFEDFDRFMLDDVEALKKDWQQVGEDIWKALKQYEAEDVKKTV